MLNFADTKKVLDINTNIRDDMKADKQRDMDKNHGDKNKNDKAIKISEDNKMMNMLLNKMKEMETEYDMVEHLVIDIGNSMTKVGYSGEDLPTFQLPSIYGEYKYDLEKKNEYNMEMKSYLYGYEALDPAIKENYNVKFLKPGDHKNLIDFEYFDFIKEILENKLNVNPSDYKVMLNISPIKNPENIVRLGKILFEDLNFKAFALVNSASLSLFSTGRTSGLVVECGETRSYVVPIYEGFPLYHALNKNRIGGRDLTNVICDGIQESGLNVSPDDLYNLRQIKENMCSVPYLKDIDHYINSNDDIISQEKLLYKLPDEKIISIPKASRLKAAELLFNPSYLGKTERGLVPMIADSIKKTVNYNEEFKKTMLNNIVLSGGSTMMHGFSQRIKKTLHQNFDVELPSNTPTNVISENNRYISTWIGASMVASMSSFDKVFIKKDEYNEVGEDRLSLFSKIF